MEEARQHSALIRLVVFSSFAWAISLVFAPVGWAADRHAGYYYPAPKQIESYRARARVLPKNNRAIRLDFVNRLALGSLNKSYPAPYAIFAKGLNAEKMIIVSNVKDQLDTVYRVRALLATMTAVARNSPVFKEFKVETILTFLDLAKMLGFRQITISDGEKFTHQVLLK